mmetsp:Transcript_36630/g.88768  ORF Transcript_36630/g.88768 Transcript_36630/m.88768 type:complete len:161 (+) Transcript_36630:214-696(+)|eukprot:CAMPEP_0113644204 /NCGR_PEP_ID=MMETSP0017_2-20120614/23261_1 /TAXON_ID=2856 /ORGANISM="Cylindrotheca closterium" /LENGTH=160 /DNA_ID=CAMNT_0000555795 /DNA_START=102 /DNA_END=584 /DNA_ORIENTATION=- /assembly_acc=CAM_ASM_000147
MMEVDRTYRTVTFKTTCGTHVAISLSSAWLWKYLQDFHYVLSLPILKERVIPKIIEFCYHYLEEPMVDIPMDGNNGLVHLVQPWYTSFLCHLNQEVRSELLIASRILHIQPLQDLIGATLPFPHKDYSLYQLRGIFVESTSSQRQKRKMEGQYGGGSRKR